MTNEMSSLSDSVRTYAVTLFRIAREKEDLERKDKMVREIVKHRGYDPDALIAIVTESRRVAVETQEVESK